MYRFASTLTALPAVLSRIALADGMRRAHAAARFMYGGAERRGSYAACLSAALRATHAGEGRRCPVSVLRSQAIAWATFARSRGCRFDVEKKAAEAFAFSLANNLRGLCIPTKLVGTKRAQDEAASLAARIARRGAFLPLTLCPKVDRIEVAAGADVLGSLQPKHLRWAASLPAFRVAALAVTGGTEDRPTFGVNVALEVWPVLPGLEDNGLEGAEPEEDGAALVMVGEEERVVFGPPPSTPARRGSSSLWFAIGGWDQ
jgi:hypothetical protein